MAGRRSSTSWRRWRPAVAISISTVRRMACKSWRASASTATPGGAATTAEDRFMVRKRRALPSLDVDDLDRFRRTPDATERDFSPTVYLDHWALRELSTTPCSPSRSSRRGSSETAHSHRITPEKKEGEHRSVGRRSDRDRLRSEREYHRVEITAPLAVPLERLNRVLAISERYSRWRFANATPEPDFR